MTCPICETSCPPRSRNKSYPFCSHRCQMIDLGRWLDGDYRIPGEPASDIVSDELVSSDLGERDDGSPWLGPGPDSH